MGVTVHAKSGGTPSCTVNSPLSAHSLQDDSGDTHFSGNPTGGDPSGTCPPVGKPQAKNVSGKPVCSGELTGDGTHFQGGKAAIDELESTLSPADVDCKNQPFAVTYSELPQPISAFPVHHSTSGAATNSYAYPIVAPSLNLEPVDSFIQNLNLNQLTTSCGNPFPPSFPPSFSTSGNILTAHNFPPLKSSTFTEASSPAIHPPPKDGRTAMEEKLHMHNLTNGASSKHHGNGILGAAPSSPPAPSSAPVPSPPLGASKTWSSVVTNLPKASNMKLTFIQPALHNGAAIARPPQSIFQQGTKHWEASLIGYFIDKRLPYTRVEPLVRKMWHNQGLCQVLVSSNGLFIFKFETKEQCSKILEGGPYHLYGNPLFLKAWQPLMTFSKDCPKTVPIWAHLHGVPLELWSAEGLSHVASVIGNPLFADAMTSSHHRLSFAKVCIDMDPAKSFPNEISLETPNGEVIAIKVDYPWLPRKCTTCQNIGHVSSNCPSKPKQIWQIKRAPSMALSNGNDWTKVTKAPKQKPSTPDHLVQPSSPPNQPRPEPVKATSPPPNATASKSRASKGKMKAPKEHNSAGFPPNKFSALVGFDELDSLTMEEEVTSVGLSSNRLAHPSLEDEPIGSLMFPDVRV